MCGILGIVSNRAVNQDLFDGLNLLQHRGQDAAGIVTMQNGQFFLRKDNGLVSDVIRTRHMRRLQGNIGIGHVRYPTAGSASCAEAQPFYVNFPFGLTLAHNGNITNADLLKQELINQNSRHLNTLSDSEILLNVFADELYKQTQVLKQAISPMLIFAAIKGLHQRVKGAYAVVALIAGHGLVAFRDPNAIRPICFGTRKNAEHTDYMIASESIALDGTGFELARDLAPGEGIFISEEGEFYSALCADKTSYSPCMFEFVYFARPDSVMDGISIHKARQVMGRALAKNLETNWKDHDIDVIIPIPDTSRTSAWVMAGALNIEFSEGLVRNRYIARTFIMPGQSTRKKSVRQKLNPIKEEFAGKNVLLVDDSIVRGTTSEEIVRMAREAGANKVYMASAAPAVRFPNVYGIDMSNQADFIAHERTTEQVAIAIGSERLIYQSLADLTTCVHALNPAFSGFDNSCFDGVYITGDIDADAIKRLAQTRALHADQKNDDSQLDLHNDQ
ncbi:amidophosphoribosyltransferase [Gammaproteobacteria bacterium]|nr:amidophosphoribosyltransferase [Gammaproteobacteria bacterium]